MHLRINDMNKDMLQPKIPEKYKQPKTVNVQTEWQKQKKIKISLKPKENSAKRKNS